MSEARAANGRFFAQTFHNLRDICTAVHISCTPDRLRVHAIDCHQVAIFTIAVDRSDFGAYTCVAPFVGGVSLPELVAAIGDARSNDPVTFRWTSDAFSVQRGGGASRTLPAVETFELEPPPWDHSASFSFSNKLLRSLLNTIVLMSEDRMVVKITATGNVARFDAHCDNGGGAFWLQAEDAACARADAVSVSALYMQNVLKVCCADRVAVKLTRDRPVEISCDVLGRSRVECHLSPIIPDPPPEAAD